MNEEKDTSRRKPPARQGRFNLNPSVEAIRAETRRRSERYKRFSDDELRKMLKEQSLESQHRDINAELFARRAERPAPIGPLDSAGKHTQVPPDFPPSYPNELKVRTEIICFETTKKFPHQSRICELCRHLVSRMTSVFREAVQAGTITAHVGLGSSGMGGLIRSWIVWNCLESDWDRFEHEVRRSPEWLKFIKAISQTESFRIGAKQTETPLPRNGPQSAETKPNRRAMVKAYIEEVRSKKNKRITKRDIWRLAGYRARTEFERWERQDSKRPNKAAHENFSRILREKPHLK